MRGLFIAFLLVAAVLANKNSVLMSAKETEVTDTQTKVNPDGSKVNIYFAQHKDTDSGTMIYYKKIVDEARKDTAGYNPEIYFRYAPNEEWRLLPKGCPAPEIKPKEGTDKCEMGWKIGKVIATTAVYLGMKKGEEEATIAGPTATTPQTYSATGTPGQVVGSIEQQRIAKTRQAIAEAAAKLSANLQECLKTNLSKTGFTVEKVCLHKGLVAESGALVNSLKEHASDPAYKCDYATLKENSKCMPTK